MPGGRSGRRNAGDRKVARNLLYALNIAATLVSGAAGGAGLSCGHLPRRHPERRPISGAALLPMTIPRLALAHITKTYPAVVANSDVSLTVLPGEIHAVLGENGAGKSTLMKTIYGAVKPDQGTVHFDGREVHIRNPQEARALGISMVFQHFSLFDTLTVAENVWLGLDRRPAPGRGEARHP